VTHLGHIIVIAVAAYLLAWSIYLLALPLLSRFSRRSEVRPSAPGRSPTPAIAVLIPAHDMEHCIERCIRSLLASDYPSERVTIYVVADHCSDRTAAVGQAAGAKVLVREEAPAGKTFALDWAFRRLRELGVESELYVVVDATARVGEGFLRALGSRWAKGESVIMAHTMVDPANQRWFARCLGLTLAHRNLQDMARERLKLSALVCGRGMAFGHDYINEHGWSLAAPPPGSPPGNHPTEDFRHGVRLAEHGYRVAFAPDAHLFTPLRQSLEAATRQNVRWERGRIGNAYTHASTLMAKALRERSRRKMVAAMDAIQPPVAVTLGLSIILALSAVLFAEAPTVITLASLPLVLVFLYSTLVIGQGRQEGIELTALLWAPVYIAWRLSTFVAALTGLDRLFERSTRPTTPR
jgi:1,2-diacylglycerol 3-beta-glucosyltransferase